MKVDYIPIYFFPKKNKLSGKKLKVIILLGGRILFSGTISFAERICLLGGMRSFGKGISSEMSTWKRNVGRSLRILQSIIC